MNYFPFNVGDYAAHTGHLEPMEDLAYRRLLDQYYLREGSLPADIQATAKLVRLRSMMADVESVLNEFFRLTDAGWEHKRCDEEIAKMQDKQAKARDAAELSVKSRRAAAERRLEQQQTDVERTLPEKQTDVQLPTPTPTPTPTPVLNTTAKAVGASLRKAQTPLPDGFEPDSTGIEAAREKHVNVQAELPKFKNYHMAKASLMADWQAAWRTWVGNARPSAFVAKPADWWTVAGFDNEYEARNVGCSPSTAKFFRDGKRIAQAVA